MTDPTPEPRPYDRGDMWNNTEGQCVLGHDEPRRRDIGTICNWHAARLNTILSDIRTDFLDLALIAEAGSAPKDTAPKTRHLKSSSPPTPANLDVLVLLDARTSSVRLTHLLRYDNKPAVDRRLLG